MRITNSNNYVQPKVTYSNVLKSTLNSSDTNNNNLFSPTELINITKDLLTSLRTASSKEEQILAIATIVSKYVYND